MNLKYVFSIQTIVISLGSTTRNYGFLDFLWIRKPLHLAARRGNLDTVKFLVSKGGDINIKDKKGVSI